MSMKNAYIIAGPNGAGKTTFAEKFLPEYVKCPLFFLWIPSPQLAIERIKDRVADGGHNVPSQDVRRRFPRSIKNFLQTYRPLFNSWMLFNNAEIKPMLIAKEKDGILTVIDKNLFFKITDEIGVKI